MSDPLRHFVRATVPFPLRRWIVRVKSIRSLADLLGRWSTARFRASISRHASARIWRQINVGPGVIVDAGTHFHTNDDGAGFRIVVEEGSFIGRNCFFSAGEIIQVGKYCNIGATCQLLAAGHAYDDPTHPYVYSQVVSYGRMRLGSNSWIGAGSILLGGIEVGFGSVVAAGSIVRESLPPLCLAAGQPLRVLKLFDWPSRRWIRLPEEKLAREFVLARHLAALPCEADYVLQLKKVNTSRDTYE